MSRKRKGSTSTAVALALVATAAGAQTTRDGGTAARERCYGVALKGANDGIGTEEAADAAPRDYQGDAWTWVPQDACLIMTLPPQPDGTPRRGAFEPLERDRG